MGWTLIRKDLRLLRPVFLTAAGLAVLFYVLLPAIQFRQWKSQQEQVSPLLMGLHRSAYWANYHLTWREYAEAFGGSLQSGTLFGWLICALLWAVIVGMAFATERRERWADFAAMLPVERAAGVRAKALACIVACGSLVAVNLVVLGIALVLGPHYMFHVDQTLLNVVLPWLAGTMLMVGLAWLMSAWLASPVMAVAIAIGGGGSVFLWLLQVGVMTMPPMVKPWCWLGPLEIGGLSVGLAALVAGTFIQVRRRTP